MTSPKTVIKTGYLVQNFAENGTVQETFIPQEFKRCVWIEECRFKIEIDQIVARSEAGCCSNRRVGRS